MDDEDACLLGYVLSEVRNTSSLKPMPITL